MLRNNVSFNKNFRVRVASSTKPFNTVSIEDQVMNMYHKGMSYTEIAAQTGLTTVKIGKIVKKRTVNTVCRGKLSQSDRNKIVAAIKKGEKFSSVARKYGVTPETIRYHVKRSAKGSEMIPLSAKEADIKSLARTARAKEIAKAIDLQECTTRNYACARHVSLEFDRIAYKEIEMRKIRRFIAGTSDETISELATMMGRTYASVYNKIESERKRLASLPPVV